jgi:hypothetical protein
LPLEKLPSENGYDENMSDSEQPFQEVKRQWNVVLDRVLDQDRIAWLAFFDARLASLENDQLTLSFADSQKFGGQHDFAVARNPKHTEILMNAIHEVTGFDLTIREK